MKRISILTFWSVPNYGAFAQAYALNRFVKSIKPDVDVEHIAYLHPKHWALYFKKSRPALVSKRQLLSRSFYKQWVSFIRDKQIKYPYFSQDWDMIPHIEVESESKLEEMRWDTVITGSDAIWEYSIGEFGDDVHLIGNRLKCNKLIAYAASFGNMNIGDTFPVFVKSGLEKYNAISVRDQSSYDIICNQLQRNVKCPIVLDPTLLYDFKKDGEIPAPAYEKYILVYGNEFSETLIQEVKKYARKNDLQIIGAGIAPEWCDIRLTEIRPIEWIGMFSGADFVVTCTFHGLMFSINYNKKVVFNQIEYVRNRSEWLLELLGLSYLYESAQSLKDILDYEWDYDCINMRLSEVRKESQRFLEEVLADE